MHLYRAPTGRGDLGSSFRTYSVDPARDRDLGPWNVCVFCLRRASWRKITAAGGAARRRIRETGGGAGRKEIVFFSSFPPTSFRRPPPNAGVTLEWIP